MFSITDICNLLKKNIHGWEKRDAVHFKSDKKLVVFSLNQISRHKQGRAL